MKSSSPVATSEKTSRELKLVASLEIRSARVRLWQPTRLSVLLKKCHLSTKAKVLSSNLLSTATHGLEALRETSSTSLMEFRASAQDLDPITVSLKSTSQEEDSSLSMQTKAGADLALKLTMLLSMPRF